VLVGVAAAGRDSPDSGHLPPAAIAFRSAHTLITLLFLAAIAHVWWCALTGRRGRLLNAAVTALAGEGLLVLVNGGDCPLGGLGERLGDPVPLFELVLPRTAARRAVPVLGIVAAAGAALLARRPPRARVHARG
jgi:hypothetical protein